MQLNLYFRKNTPVFTINSCSVRRIQYRVIVHFPVHLVHLPSECQFFEGEDYVFSLSIPVFPGSSTLLVPK